MRSASTQTPGARLASAARSTLWDEVPRDHRESQRDFRRRQAVTATTLVVGTVVLGLSLNIEPGSSVFYLATLALPIVWTVGALAAGPLHLGHRRDGDALARPIVAPVIVALVLVAVFILGGLVTRQIPVFGAAVEDLLAYAREGTLWILLLITAINGVAEEVFFRGALYASIPGRHQVAITATLYCLAILPAGNLPLAFAAALLGVVVGLERRASGGILGPIITHLVWSLSMLLILPMIF